MSDRCDRIVYCHCAFAKVVPAATKNGVLTALAESGVEFDAVPDLCEMAARSDARLRELTADGAIAVAACYPRAVQWLLASAGADVPDGSVRVWNMRVESAETVVNGLLGRSATSINPPGARP
jgi:hypothetical protein